MLDKIGVVIFDDEDAHASGWAALPQGESFRIGTTADLSDAGRGLSSDFVWVTNLDDTALFRAGLGNHTRFRSRSFLHEKLHDLGARLGVPEDDPRAMAEVMATVVYRVLLMGNQLVGLEKVPQRSLSEGLRRHLWPEFNPVVDDEVQRALQDATTWFQTCESYNRMRRAQFGAVMFPQASYSAAILSEIRVPSPDWSQVRTAQLPDSPEKVNGWAKEMPFPLLARVRISDFDPDVYPLINYGGGFGATDQRVWLSLPELVWMSEVSAVTVLEAFVSREWLPIPMVDDLLDNLGGGEDIYNLSVSASLFLHNAWLSLGLQWHRPGPSQAGSINPITPFLRAMDRHQCFYKAAELACDGVVVRGYGMGRFIVSLPSTAEMSELVTQIAYPHNLIPPYTGITEEQERRATHKMPAQPEWLTATQRLFAAPEVEGADPGYLRALATESRFFTAPSSHQKAV
ncbi:hypothetical protein [Thiolapillus sp.]|uniref:hypothetical protein n=5 Tax=Thiolapillus sp. TaxID=2017437 RepID=UPI0025EACDB0|nr:hypothetical protein [Thiolapillus sp.]